jgi:hypothetical protein
LSVLAVASARHAGGQYMQGKPYFSIAAGVTLQQQITDPYYANDLYGTAGPALAVAGGGHVSDHVAIEGRFGLAGFGAPTYTVSPGGCLGQPCPPRRPIGELRVYTVAGDAVWVSSRKETGPLLLAGLGIRDVADRLGNANEVRPYAEIGAGIAGPLGSSQVFIDARYQRTPSRAFVPAWMLPIELGFRL